MAYIYCADIYCDSCGEDICERRKKEIMEGKDGVRDAGGNNPTRGKPMTEEEFDAIYSDERNYDSGVYPKHADDDEESDTPQHCGSGEDCLEAEVLPSGRKIGALIGTGLTSDGVEYLKEQLKGGGEVADFWREQFSDYDIETVSVIESDRDFDEFLNDATDAVARMWKDRGGKELSLAYERDLHVAIMSFFAGKRG